MGFTTLRTPPLSLRRHHFSSAATRLKREDHPLPTNLENLFSEWKILVGPTDWQEYFSGAEGSERYKLHNVKGVPFSPGVYELAICPNEHARTYRRRSSRKIKKNSTIVVYVGQAENIYSRLQEYGRTGSHLESSGDAKCAQSFKSSQHCDSAHGKLSSDEAVCDCPCLFTKAFSQGYPIAFRWTQAKSGVDARSIEAGLLKLFDYAWNRESNGERRANDTFKKLEYESEQLRIKSILKALNKLFRRNDGLAVHQLSKAYRELGTLPWNFQEKKEALVSIPQCKNFETQKDPSVQKPNICGVQDANGMVCKEVPLHGRKRCSMHKGVKLYPSFKTATVAWRFREQENEHAILIPCDSIAGELTETRHNPIICGVIDATGTICRKVPIHGRKRCDIHKGMRVGCYATASVQKVCGIVDANGIVCNEKPLHGRRRCNAHKSMRLYSSS